MPGDPRARPSTASTSRDAYMRHLRAARRVSMGATAYMHDVAPPATDSGDAQLTMMGVARDADDERLVTMHAWDLSTYRGRARCDKVLRPMWQENARLSEAIRAAKPLWRPSTSDSTRLGSTRKQSLGGAYKGETTLTGDQPLHSPKMGVSRRRPKPDLMQKLGREVGLARYCQKLDDMGFPTVARLLALDGEALDGVFERLNPYPGDRLRIEGVLEKEWAARRQVQTPTPRDFV